MKKLKVKIVANNAEWQSWPEKIETLQKWFAWKVNLQVTLEHTFYKNIPFSEYRTPNNDTGWLGVDRQWYDDHIAIDALGYDIVLFVMNTTDWREKNKARGWRTDKEFGPVELQIACDEHEKNYWPDGRVVGTFLDYARHEIMHALFMLTNQTDTTHYWWDQGKLENALQEVRFPEPHTSEEISRIQKLIEILTALLTRKRKQLEILQNQPPQTKKPTVRDFALAVQEYEGYYAPGENPKFPNGTLAWRNKNPGNLRYVGQKRAIGRDKLNFAIFKTYEDGFQTLVEMITRAVQGKSTIYLPEYSIAQYFKIYAPSADSNNPDAYAVFVAQKLNVPVDTKINTLVIS